MRKTFYNSIVIISLKSDILISAGYLAVWWKVFSLRPCAILAVIFPPRLIFQSINRFYKYHGGIINSDISLISSKRLYVIELNNFNGKIHRQQTDKMFSVVCMLDKKKVASLMAT